MPKFVDLLNTPTGSDDQFFAAKQAREIIIYGELLLTLLTPIAVGFLSKDIASIMIQAYFLQAIIAGVIAFFVIERRLDKLREIRSEIKYKNRIQN